MESIEIPFGAKDSELKGWEYKIPEGFEAKIKDGKIIVKQAESEDERIRKEIHDLLVNCCEADRKFPHLLAWLEKQKEQKLAEWRPYDKEVLTKIKELIDSHFSEHEQREVYKDWLDEHIGQPAEWSKEDRDRVAQYLHDRNEKMLWPEAEKIASDILDRLRPQPHWKPSEEQMCAFKLAMIPIRDKHNASVSGIPAYDTLCSLYDDLKKLMWYDRH